MPGVELKISVRGGHVVAALRGDLDIIGSADAEAAITGVMARGQSLIIDMSALDFIDCSSLGTLLRVRGLARRGGDDVMLAAPQRHVLRLLALTGRDHAFLVHASVQAAVVGLPGRGARYGGGRLRCEHCMVWEGSAIAYWYRVIAAGAAAVRAGSLRGRMRGCGQPVHGRVAGGRACQLGTSRTAGTREQEA